MSDTATWFENNFATLILAAVTAILVYVTYTLKKATDNLARTAIRPKLILLKEPHTEHDQRGVLITVVNRGVGTAFNTKLSVKDRNGVTFRVDRIVAGDRDIIPNGTALFAMGDAVTMDIEITFEYDDSDNHHYSETYKSRTP